MSTSPPRRYGGGSGASPSSCNSPAVSSPPVPLLTRSGGASSLPAILFCHRTRIPTDLELPRRSLFGSIAGGGGGWDDRWVANALVPRRLLSFGVGRWIPAVLGTPLPPGRSLSKVAAGGGDGRRSSSRCGSPTTPHSLSANDRQERARLRQRPHPRPWRARDWI